MSDSKKCEVVRTNRKSSTLNMTEGNILKLILVYSFPLLLGNLFQNLYNTVDSLIVGNFIGKTSLAAIGSTGSLIHLLVGFFNGFSMGGTVVVSQFFGAGDREKVQKTVHTMVAATIIVGIILTGIGILLSPYLLRLMKVPEDVRKEALIYLAIYFSGILFLIFYNMSTGILRAVGDTKNPLIYLIISSILNIILDLFFIVVLKKGIGGAALATVVSQAVSASLVLIRLKTSQECYRLEWKKIKIDFTILRKIIKYGFPGALQMTIFSFSNMLAQRYINVFGADVIAGQAAFQKIDSLALLPLISLGVGITTYASQNYGAGKIHRVRIGNEIAMWLSVLITVVIGVTLAIFAPQLCGLFNSDENVVRYGSFFVRTASCVCMIRSINEVYTGTLNGVGNPKAPVIIKLSGFVVFRQLWLFVVTRFSDSFFLVGISFAVGWAFGNIVIAFYYYWYMNKRFGKFEKVRKEK